MKRGLIALLLLLALTACGGGDGEESSAADATPEAVAETSAGSSAASPEVAPEDALEDAYRSYIKAFLAGDGATAYQLLSERCRDKEPLSSFAAASEAAAELYGEVDYTIESVTVDGEEGRVDADYAAEVLNSGGGSLWVHEDGGWHSDKCD